MFLLSVLFFLSTHLLLLPSHGEEPHYTFHITNTPGKPLRISWEDGREASLMVSRTNTKYLKLPFSITENSCTHVNSTHCFYTIPLQREFMELRWSRHPRPEKIGKLVLDSSNNSTNNPYTLFRSSFLIDIFSEDYDASLHLAEKPFLECEPLGWFPQHGNQPASISNWLNQTMKTNMETGLNENRLNNKFGNIETKMNANQQIEFIKLGWHTKSSYFYSNSSELLPESLSVLVFSHSNSSCQMTFQFDADSLQKSTIFKILFLDEFNPATANYRPFISGENAYLKKYGYGWEQMLTKTIQPAGQNETSTIERTLE